MIPKIFLNQNKIPFWIFQRQASVFHLALFYWHGFDAGVLKRWVVWRIGSRWGRRFKKIKMRRSQERNLTKDFLWDIFRVKPFSFLFLIRDLFNGHLALDSDWDSPVLNYLCDVLRPAREDQNRKKFQNLKNDGSFWNILISSTATSEGGSW